MEEGLIQKTKLLLSRVPFLKRKLQEITNQIKNHRAYRRRAQEILSLFEKYSIRQKRINGPQHIILIVADALRRDHLSLYNYERDTTPFLKSLAEKAAVFESAITPSPWTYPTVASILTGLYPHNHGAVHSQDPRNFDNENPNKLCQDILALPEILENLGVKCCFMSEIATAFISVPGRFKYSSIFYGGTKHHMKKLLKWLGNNENKSTFVYFQLADLHAPISVPKRLRNVFGEIPNIPKLENWRFLKESEQEGPDFNLYRENRLKLYDSALRFVDEQIGRLFDYLEKTKLLDSCLVIITADHGEEFWEHKDLERKLFFDPRGIHGAGHGHNLFQEIINVPLICVGPGITPGYRSHYVSLVDIVPTILELCGIEHKLGLCGRNLFDHQKKRFLLSEGIAYGYEKKAIFENNWKLIHSKGDGVDLLFDLSQDPKEKHDLSKVETEHLERLKAALPHTETKGELLEVDGEIRKQLQDLGYV